MGKQSGTEFNGSSSFVEISSIASLAHLGGSVDTSHSGTVSINLPEVVNSGEICEVVMSGVVGTTGTMAIRINSNTILTTSSFAGASTTIARFTFVHDSATDGAWIYYTITNAGAVDITGVYHDTAHSYASGPTLDIGNMSVTGAVTAKWLSNG